MDDARYVLFEELKEKNATKRGAYHKVRGGGRHVKMPSDTLTRKEKQALNGDVKTYRLGEPMVWAEFLLMPREMQVSYINRLDAEYDPTNGQLGDMFGVSAVTVSRFRAENDVKRPSGKAHPTADKVRAWEAFLGKVRTPETQPSDASSCDDMGTVEVAPSKDVVTELSALLRALAGSGARITIEVTL